MCLKGCILCSNTNKMDLLKISCHIYPIIWLSLHNMSSSWVYISPFHMNFCSVIPPSMGLQISFDPVQWVRFWFGHSSRNCSYSALQTANTFLIRPNGVARTTVVMVSHTTKAVTSESAESAGTVQFRSIRHLGQIFKKFEPPIIDRARNPGSNRPLRDA